MNGFIRENIDGLKITQNKFIDVCFNKLKMEYGQPINIIEIGTCFGGFALFLKKIFSLSEIHTFDILDWGSAEYLKQRNKLFLENEIHYYNEDCFLRDGKRIIDLLKNKSILLCDGAHKEHEFSFFINHIQPESIIMAHDYGKNKEYFFSEIANKYWNKSFEFDGSKFDHECNEKEFIPYLQNDFEKAVWYIRKKV